MRKKVYKKAIEILLLNKYMSEHEKLPDYYWMLWNSWRILDIAKDALKRDRK